MMYELWKLKKKGKAIDVSICGVFKSVAAAKEAALKFGFGKYRVCDRHGDVARIEIGKKTNECPT